VRANVITLTDASKTSILEHKKHGEIDACVFGFTTPTAELLAAIDERRIPVVLINRIDPQHNYVASDHAAGMERLLATGYDTVMCFNDVVAVCTYQCALSMGLQIPEAFSLTGFDNSPVLSLVSQPITTVDLAVAKLGRRAGAWHRERIIERSDESLQLQVPGEVVAGFTVAARPDRALERCFELAGGKILALNKRWNPQDGTPVFTVAGRYTSRGWTEWTQGFQFGNAVYQFDATVDYMASHVSRIGVHDHGFNNVSTYGNLLRLMREGRDRYDVRGRVVHESIFNVTNGVYRCPSTQQGCSPFTTWTRGLSWILCDFAEELEAGGPVQRSRAGPQLGSGHLRSGLPASRPLLEPERPRRTARELPPDRADDRANSFRRAVPLRRPRPRGHALALHLLSAQRVGSRPGRQRNRQR